MAWEWSGVELDRPTCKASECLIETPLFLENAAQNAVGLGRVGFELQCPAAGGDRRVGQAHVVKDDAEVGSGPRRGRGEVRDRPLAGGDRLVEPALGSQGVAQD